MPRPPIASGPPEVTRSSLEVWLPGEPVPASRPRIYRGRAAGKTPRSAEYAVRVELLIRHRLLQWSPMYERWRPFEGPLRVELTTYHPRPKTRPACVPLEVWRSGEPCWKPNGGRGGDVDNLAKAVLDACTKAGVWGDDSQVVELTVRKRWVGTEEHDPHEVGADLLVAPLLWSDR